ncbi:hypothetical protein, variant [Aphanomyces invadans]|uniref:Mediator of RNA polymerase II transcription subunit 7 n=1 Tax=Aphanomyces invadans TaxID=157072 RepID=A0A024TSY5_9STRA|nr:hypothetical protein, variant [Aphanomyces invadans]ETV97265.1 hypothetical protein, variant [Aphanomyces invadans]|eukprot:XP_008873973.1 hypothetical protein, variant [Aphanomyces invadans]
MQQVEEPELVSAFPAPPVFFSLYTDGADAGPTPPPPLKPTYHSFGTPYSTEDAVPDLLPDDKKVYPKDYNVKDEMKKVNRSLMYSFLELIDVLILNPTKFNAKLDDIEQLFLNMHNLINAYRPHQARETLIDLLKQQIQDRRDASAEIRQYVGHFAGNSICALYSSVSASNEGVMLNVTTAAFLLRRYFSHDGATLTDFCNLSS